MVALEVEDPGVVRQPRAIHPGRVRIEVDGRRPRAHQVGRLLRLADGDGSSEQGDRDEPQDDGEGETENLAHVRFLPPPGRSAPATVSPPGAAVNGRHYRAAHPMSTRTAAPLSPADDGRDTEMDAIVAMLSQRPVPADLAQMPQYRPSHEVARAAHRLLAGPPAPHPPRRPAPGPVHAAGRRHPLRHGAGVGCRGLVALSRRRPSGTATASG